MYVFLYMTQFTSVWHIHAMMRGQILSTLQRHNVCVFHVSEDTTCSGQCELLSPVCQTFCLLAICFCFCTNGKSGELAPLGLFPEPLTLSTVFTGHHPQVFYYLMWQLKCRETGKGTLLPCLKTFLIPIWWFCSCVTADIKYFNLPGSQRNTQFIEPWCLRVT